MLAFTTFTVSVSGVPAFPSRTSLRERRAGLQDSPVGELRISAPAGFAAVHLVPALKPFLATYPALSVRLVVTDDVVDIIRERIDLAVTISRPCGTAAQRGRPHAIEVSAAGQVRLAIGALAAYLGPRPPADRKAAPRRPRR